MTTRLYLVYSLLVCWLCTSSYADSVQDVTHFMETDLAEVEIQLKARLIDISSSQRDMMLAEIDVRDRDSKDETFLSIWANLNQKSDSVTCADIIELLSSLVMCHEFCNHKDVLIRYRANITLAATGDKDAADELCKIFADGSLSNFDARLIRTGCLEIGIDPKEATSDMLIDYLGSFVKPHKFKEGDEIADFEATDTEGIVFKLSEHRGKFVVIHFWATNCGPCMARMPDTKVKIDSLPADRIEVLFVSLDYDDEAFAKAKGDIGIKCRHVFDGRSIGGPIPRHFRVNRMPLDIVIDPEGRYVSNSLDSLAQLLINEKETGKKGR